MNTATIGIVLAGGAARRMGGEDKGMTPLHGRPVVERVLALFAPQCDRVLIVANRNQDRYAQFARVIGDETPGHPGPLAGIAAALAHIVEGEPESYTESRWLLTSPVDCPDLPSDLRTRLQEVLSAAQPAPCVYAIEPHKKQPLFAMYSLAYKEKLLESARAAVALHASPFRWHLELGAIPVDFSDRAEAFRNLNTPQEFSAYESEHEAG